jgi:hypothetical protein
VYLALVYPYPMNVNNPVFRVCTLAICCCVCFCYGYLLLLLVRDLVLCLSFFQRVLVFFISSYFPFMSVRVQCSLFVFFVLHLDVFICFRSCSLWLDCYLRFSIVVVLS